MSVTWHKIKYPSATCHACGASRDYIEIEGDKFKCTLCGKTWERY